MNPTTVNLLRLSIVAARKGSMEEAFGLFLDGASDLIPETTVTTASAPDLLRVALEEASKECKFNFECSEDADRPSNPGMGVTLDDFSGKSDVTDADGSGKEPTKTYAKIVGTPTVASLVSLFGK